MLGDLAIYSHNTVGYIHVGLVLSLEQGVSPTGKPFPKILSKWDDVSGEYIHYPGDVPFQGHFSDFQLRYWTEPYLLKDYSYECV